MKWLLPSVLVVIVAGAATAQVVPAPESPSEARQRLQAALGAPDPKSTSPLIARYDNWGDRVILDINAGSEPEPVTVAIRAAHSALARAEKAGRLPEVIVNVTWGGMFAGFQLFRDRAFEQPVASMTVEQWLGRMIFSGSSEKGLIGMVSWCRRGGQSQAPGICSSVREKAIERNVWQRAGG